MNQKITELQKLIDLYQKDIYQLAFAYVQDWDQAAELMQMVFYQALEKGLSEDPKLAKKQLLTILISESHRFLASKKTKGRMSQPNNQHNQTLAHHVLQLPLNHREPILLFYVCELASEEIAELLQTNPFTIRTRLENARTILIEETNHEGLDSTRHLPIREELHEHIFSKCPTPLSEKELITQVLFLAKKKKRRPYVVGALVIALLTVVGTLAPTLLKEQPSPTNMMKEEIEELQPFEVAKTADEWKDHFLEIWGSSRPAPSALELAYTYRMFEGALLNREITSTFQGDEFFYRDVQKYEDSILQYSKTTYVENQQLTVVDNDYKEYHTETIDLPPEDVLGRLAHIEPLSPFESMQLVPNLYEWSVEEVSEDWVALTGQLKSGVPNQDITSFRIKADIDTGIPLVFTTYHGEVKASELNVYKFLMNQEVAIDGLDLEVTIPPDYKEMSNRIPMDYVWEDQTRKRMMKHPEVELVLLDKPFDYLNFHLQVKEGTDHRTAKNLAQQLIDYYKAEFEKATYYQPNTPNLWEVFYININLQIGTGETQQSYYGTIDRENLRFVGQGMPVINWSQ